MKREKVRRSNSPSSCRYSRRDFLKLGGASLAGATLLGSAACGGGGEQGGGPTTIVFSFGPDESGTLQELIRRFNEQSDNVQV